jgi:hypothetical protein
VFKINSFSMAGVCHGQNRQFQHAWNVFAEQNAQKHSINYFQSKMKLDGEEEKKNGKYTRLGADYVTPGKNATGNYCMFASKGPSGHTIVMMKHWIPIRLAYKSCTESYGDSYKDSYTCRQPLTMENSTHGS